MEQKPSILRLSSLDVFRGITIALMILVNSPGNREAYVWLEHSVWDGCSLADLVFPFFIVMVGVSSVLALTNLRAKGISDSSLMRIILRRSLYLFMLGVLLNILPKHFDLTTLRIPGVLQRIALCYFFASILFLKTSVQTQRTLVVILLLGYWGMLSYFAGTLPLSMEHNPIGYVDQWLLSSAHLYTPGFDPEGVLSTIPAVGSALLGILLGEVLISSRTKPQQLQWMAAVGVLLCGLGWGWSLVFPLNKALWSSSYVLWTSGLAFLAFAGCFALIEMRGWVLWSKPFLIFGKSALLVYFLHVLFLKIQAVIPVHGADGALMNLRLYITQTLFGHLSPKNASLCYAVAYTLLWLAVLAGLALRAKHRRVSIAR